MSSMLGQEASADILSNISVEETGNSQTMALLTPSGASTLIFQDKKSKKADKIDENTEVSLSGNALVPTVREVASGTGGGESAPFIDTSIYVVREGDTLSQIAEMFDVSQNTILWANDMRRGDAIKEGDVLLILPVSGIEHTVKKGETLKGIAGKYKVEVEEILLYNNLAEGATLALGDSLIIPGAEMFDETPKSSGKSAPKSQTNLKNISGYYINPLPVGRKTRGITNSHKGVDIASPTGTPIYAAALGRVSLARTGYNGGFGTMVVIEHPNGTETLYSHMSRLNTFTGAQVAQGEVIGYVGSTGRSTGPHLHFEVHGAKNPLN